MSTSGTADQPLPATPDRGHTLAVWSLLMLPFLLVSAAIGGIVGMVLLGFGDLEGSEHLSEQGVWGWSAYVLSTLLFMTPMMIGVVLGARARKLGERKLGTIGMAVDGTIFIAYTTLGTYSWLTQ